MAEVSKNEHVEPNVEPYVEPWMRGPLPHVHTLLSPTLFSFQQAREDIAKWTEGLTTEQIWHQPHGFGSVGFHIRHTAGSTDRLTTYLRGDQLSSAQLAALKTEHDGGATREELLEHLEQAFRNAESAIQSLDVNRLTEPRGVGRRKLPTTVIGLLVHIAEHTQRHVGQAISAAKWAKVNAQAPESGNVP